MPHVFSSLSSSLQLSTAGRKLSLSSRSLAFILGAAGLGVVCNILHRRASPGIEGVPIVRGWIPFVGVGLSFIRNPTVFFQNLRRRHGDTFVVYLFGLRLFCVFSNDGLRSLYTVREADASFTEATRGLLGLKLPKEIIADGDLRKFHMGLRRPLLQRYLAYTESAVLQSLAELPAQGTFDLFAHMKGVMHRVGLQSWVGPEAAAPHHFARLVAAFEVLDPETAFKNLGSLASTMVTGYAHERAAMSALRDVLVEIVAAREARQRAGEDVPEDNLTSLCGLYSDLPAAERAELVARDVYHFHLASLANMYAALAWTVVMLLASPPHMAAVRKEMDEAVAQHGLHFYLVDEVLEKTLPTLEAVFQESLRLAQQSITLRKVMQPIQFATERGVHQIPPGFYLTTLLSVTNTSVDHVPGPSEPSIFNPDRYEGSKLKTPDGTRYGVSTFGHGLHACPGQRFATHATKLVLALHLRYLGLTAVTHEIAIPPSSVGAIGRSEKPFIVRFTKRTQAEDGAGGAAEVAQ